MGLWQVYLGCVAGVVLSIVIPVLSKAVRKEFDLLQSGGKAGPGLNALPPPETQGGMLHSAWNVLSAVWPAARPYALLGAFSLLVALLVVAFLGDALTDWRSALIAGYLWDSTVQKITGRP